MTQFKDLIDACGMSLRGYSNVTGIKINTVQSHSKGVRNPDKKVIEALTKQAEFTAKNLGGLK